ncbi:protein PmbA [Rodentibacter pneumotropicus]|uniref:Protein PmbA n=1 Tax=Rodentibacter pneumotropicus TaxID=758 RepID=A0A3S4U8L9_9PAST|nr:protein PmbA [Rodentibacter pneumotropicus]
MKTAENQTALLKAQEQELRQAVSFALEVAQKAGATAEVGVTKVSGLSVSTRLQEIENVEFTNDGALGISVYLGQQKGNASTSDLSDQAIKSTVEAALAIAKYTSPDDCTGLAEKELMAFEAIDLELYHVADVDVEKATALALQTEKAALGADNRIINSNGASFNSHTGVRVYGNTHGMLQSYLSSRYSLSCSVIGGEEDALENDYEYTISRDFNQLEPAQWVGEIVPKSGCPFESAKTHYP